ncbi:MAG: hypothetical protein RL141_257 [Candidatus Parcubacteria bacterium]|jgi:hypothetical protein
MTPKLTADIHAFLKQHVSEIIRKKLSKGYKLSDFKVNPFSTILLSSGMLGELTGQNMARSLLYPRVYGTSVNTILGNSMQGLCTTLLGAKASGMKGMDIEFTDRVTGEYIVMQLKAGPNTINAGDVGQIITEMKEAFRLIRQNAAGTTNMPLFAIGITYGRFEEVSAHYKKIHDTGVGNQLCVELLVGQHFWHRLTGDERFYHDLGLIFVDVFEKENFSQAFNQAVEKIAKEIEGAYFTDGIFDLDKTQRHKKSAAASPFPPGVDDR